MGQVSSRATNSHNKGYHKLYIWIEAHKLVLMVYEVSTDFPKSELFGLTSQLRRAAVSIAANIVEGHVKHFKKEFHHHLEFSNGSLVEVEYYFELVRDLGYINEETYMRLEAQRILVGNLLHGFLKSLKA